MNGTKKTNNADETDEARAAAEGEIPSDGGDAGTEAATVDYRAECETLRAEADGLRAETEKARKTVENYVAAYKKMRADFENFKRRTAESAENSKGDGVIEAVKALLPVYDTVKLAIGMTKDAAAKEGITMVMKKFKEGLAGLGVTEIPSYGEKLDPNFHDALVAEVLPEAESGVITDVLAEGFMLGDRVLRHASVKVAR